MSAVVMALAWKSYRDSHVGCDKFYRGEFAGCLRAAWQAVKYASVYNYDTRPMHERGHMYQAI